MRPGPPSRGERRLGLGESGSALVLALFACLGVAVAVQTLFVVVVCGERALSEELTGRKQLAVRDEGLASLRLRTLETWEATPWETAGSEPNVVSGRVEEIEDGAGWVLRGEVSLDAAVSRMMTSAWLERGRDGLDLPLAALLASSISTSPERVSPWMEVETEESCDVMPEGTVGEAMGYVVDPPQDQLLGAGCSLVQLCKPWRLDPGWSLLDSQSPCLGEHATVMAGEEGDTVTLPRDVAGSGPADPFVILVSGGAVLDARRQGELYGVLIVDDGSVLLDGTVLHGAVFASGDVDVGENGCIVFSRCVLRWATDRSLDRARLVPGTRWEGTG
jgi:hypothetical protein